MKFNRTEIDRIDDAIESLEDERDLLSEQRYDCVGLRETLGHLDARLATIARELVVLKAAREAGKPPKAVLPADGPLTGDALRLGLIPPVLAAAVMAASRLGHHG